MPGQSSLTSCACSQCSGQLRWKIRMSSGLSEHMSCLGLCVAFLILAYKQLILSVSVPQRASPQLLLRALMACCIFPPMISCSWHLQVQHSLEAFTSSSNPFLLPEIRVKWDRNQPFRQSPDRLEHCKEGLLCSVLLWGRKWDWAASSSGLNHNILERE